MNMGVQSTIQNFRVMIYARLINRVVSQKVKGMKNMKILIKISETKECEISNA